MVDRRIRSGAEVLKNVGQLLALSVSLCRHAAEHDLVASVIARLSDEDLERARLVATDRFRVPAIDGEHDRTGRFRSG